MNAPEAPFRWDPSRRAQLGTLLRGEPAEQYPEFLDDLRECCARVLALADDGRLVFVERSPESIHDYLGGALADTSGGPKRLCPGSIHARSEKRQRRVQPPQDWRSGNLIIEA